MKEFLATLTQGINRKDIPREFSSLIQVLEELGVLHIRAHNISLHRLFRFGILDISRDDIGYLSILGRDERDFVIKAKYLYGAQKGDIVLAKRIHSAFNRPHAVVVKVLKQYSTKTLALIHQSNRGGIQILDFKSHAPIPRLNLSHKSLKALPNQTVALIDLWQKTITDVLGVLGDARVDEKISLALYNREEHFSKACEEQAQSFGDSVDSSMYPTRLDLRALPFCTIDPLDAKDHDDAIYFDIQTSTLYVAIADVSEYVTPHTPLDREAKSRAFSIYFPHKSVPMLPRNLSENICSLKPNEDRLALVWKIRLHKRSGVPIKSELHEAIILSSQKLNYEEVDDFLRNPSKSTNIKKELQESLPLLYKYCQKLKKKRLLHGYDFISKEERLILDKNLDLLAIHSESQTPSHMLIEECMLLANVLSAKRLEHGIFRAHEEPRRERFEELLWDLRTLGFNAESKEDLHETICAIQQEAQKRGMREEVDRMIIRAQAQARYSATKKPHFGLGFEEYSHFTSPIRRYADLMLHRLIKLDLHDKKRAQQFHESRLPALCDMLSATERECARVEIDYKDRKYARAAQKRIGEVIEAVVIREDSPVLARAGGFLEGARIVVNEADVWRMDSIKVRLVDVDLLNAQIYGEVVAILKEKNVQARL